VYGARLLEAKRLGHIPEHVSLGFASPVRDIAVLFFLQTRCQQLCGNSRSSLKAMESHWSFGVGGCVSLSGCSGHVFNQFCPPWPCRDH
jgi:hypothetical protein